MSIVAIYDPCGITIELDIGTRGPPGLPGSATFSVEYITLNLTNISEKKITLNAEPLMPEKTILDILTGVTQKYGTDFTVSGAELSWTTLDLVENDQLRITYFI
jgi:hypothetical protein